MSGKFKSWCDSTIPTHPHSIPAAKQSLAPPHPAKGRQGFLESKACDSARCDSCERVFGVGCRAFCRSARVVVCRCGNIMEPELEPELEVEENEIGTGLCRVSWSRRSWKGARRRMRQTGGVRWPC